MREKLAICLMFKILDLLKESGANQREALSALRAAEAMLPETELQVAPTMVVET
jgi:Tfp pilus assembly protein PilX